MPLVGKVGQTVAIAAPRAERLPIVRDDLDSCRRESSQQTRERLVAPDAMLNADRYQETPRDLARAALKKVGCETPIEKLSTDTVASDAIKPMYPAENALSVAEQINDHEVPL